MSSSNRAVFIVLTCLMALSLYGLLFMSDPPPPRVTACPEDLRLCPDGSRLARAAPDCSFPDCPAGAVKKACQKADREAGFCPAIFEPVCGSDEQTYSNGCEACRNPSVDVYTLGRCPASRTACQPEQRGAAVCTMIYAPVCGSDQQTYSSACAACAVDSVAYYTDGACN